MTPAVAQVLNGYYLDARVDLTDKSWRDVYFADCEVTLNRGEFATELANCTFAVCTFLGDGWHPYVLVQAKLSGAVPIIAMRTEPKEPTT